VTKREQFLWDMLLILFLPAEARLVAKNIAVNPTQTMCREFRRERTCQVQVTTQEALAFRAKT
jgi:hypothetical protein